MLKKNELLQLLEQTIMMSVSLKQWQQNVAIAVNSKRKLPINTIINILTQRTPLRDYDEFTLFCIAEGCNVHHLEYYFTASELKDFSNRTFEEKVVKFPYRFERVVEIKENSQYITKTSVRELVRLRDAQLINYNENAQRTLQRMRSDGGAEYFAINLNRKAVDKIMKLLAAGEFVPNTLTLNISPDADFIYNKEKMTLTIKEQIQFDILDGYHRYVALSNMYNLDSRFDYPMELRLVVFPETKARQFIYQEYQKTEMRKIDADALSSTDPANEICAKIKNKLAGNIIISRNDGMIDEAVLSEMIRCLCIKSGNKYDNYTKNVIRDAFVDSVLMIQEESGLDLKQRWSIPFTVAFCLLAFTNRMNENKLLQITQTIHDKKLLTGKTVNRTIVNRIRKEVLV